MDQTTPNPGKQRIIAGKTAIHMGVIYGLLHLGIFRHILQALQGAVGARGRLSGHYLVTFAADSIVIKFELLYGPFIDPQNLVGFRVGNITVKALVHKNSVKQGFFLTNILFHFRPAYQGGSDGFNLP